MKKYTDKARWTESFPASLGSFYGSVANRQLN